MQTALQRINIRGVPKTCAVYAIRFSESTRGNKSFCLRMTIDDTHADFNCSCIVVHARSGTYTRCIFGSGFLFFDLINTGL